MSVIDHVPSDVVRREAISILARIESGAWSDRLLQHREILFDDRRDRGLLHALVLATLRWQALLDRSLAPFVRGGYQRIRPEVRAALRVGLAQAWLLDRPAPIAVSTTVSAVRALVNAPAAGLVNAVLRRALSQGPAPLDARLALPAWLVERWDHEYGPAAATAMAAAACQPARPFLVVTASEDAARVIEELEREGISTLPSTLHPRGFTVTQGAPQSTRAFERGAIVLLDEGAALVARLASPERGDARPMVDLAAAPGGKAVLMADAPDAPPLVAIEPVASRARILGEALAKHGERALVRAVRADGLRPPLRDGSCGLVLLDAPCSGTGTLRRRPEKRHRIDAQDPQRCAAVQATLLASAARLVGAQGTLVYAVCSLEPEEGREQIARFLETHQDFAAVDPRPWLGGCAEGCHAPDPHRVVLRPDISGTDGFVAARLVRR